MSSLRRCFLALTMVGVLAVPAMAQTVRLDAQDSSVRDVGRRTELTLALTDPVAWRVFTADAPMRLVIDLEGADFGGYEAARFDLSDTIARLQAGQGEAGWTRLVMWLDRPVEVQSAGMDTSGGGARLALTLRTTSEAEFSATAQVSGGEADPAAMSVEGRPLVVVIDPGHGGLDPGAEAGADTEAALMLSFALELRDVLAEAGFDVFMTREADEFVSLEARVRLARRVGADVFLSLHADSLSAGRATGATIYTLADEAVDEATRKLTERHESGDLLGGVDLGGGGDDLARVLVDLARTETRPRTQALADALVGAIDDGPGGLNIQPHRTADFSVLKAPDIPSVLVELGFMSTDRDLKRIKSPEWRAQMHTALRDGLKVWYTDDRIRASMALE